MSKPKTFFQVFHIPVEERKDQDSGRFGEGSTENAHKLIKNAMEKTGSSIEMSSNKDQSLTFLITGKQETVLKARRELLVQFQTRANTSISVPKEHHKYVLGRFCWVFWSVFDRELCSKVLKEALLFLLFLAWNQVRKMLQT